MNEFILLNLKSHSRHQMGKKGQHKTNQEKKKKIANSFQQGGYQARINRKQLSTTDWQSE